MRIRNLGVIPGGGLITANTFNDSYYNLRFTNNGTPITSPVIAVRCNIFRIDNIDDILKVRLSTVLQ
jgi:hypothetical protein